MPALRSGIEVNIPRKYIPDNELPSGSSTPLTVVNALGTPELDECKMQNSRRALCTYVSSEKTKRKIEGHTEEEKGIKHIAPVVETVESLTGKRRKKRSIFMGVARNAGTALEPSERLLYLNSAGVAAASKLSKPHWVIASARACATRASDSLVGGERLALDSGSPPRSAAEGRERPELRDLYCAQNENDSSKAEKRRVSKGDRPDLGERKHVQ
ncbi:hypothetical protein C8J57DRAFT_1256000 [Mycena rebaudengoi]|nr:hypothetical protein C8J57DRAFT_1256000 [Mycena rebaudengoi]